MMFPTAAVILFSLVDAIVVHTSARSRGTSKR
jgi:hypothetical protein